MMNKKSSWWVVGLVAGFGSCVVIAEERKEIQVPHERPIMQIPTNTSQAWDEGFSLTVGTKVWFNQWNLDRYTQNTGGTYFISVRRPDGTFGNDSLDIQNRSSQPETRISSTQFAPIPQISLKYKRLFFTGSYFYDTNYSFPSAKQTTIATQSFTSAGIPDFTRESTLEQTKQLEAERKEWDAAMGLYLNPYIAVLLGYKELNIRSSYSDTFIGTVQDRFQGAPFGDLVRGSPQAFTSTDRITINGLTLGIAASVPITWWKGLGMYGSYAHGFMNANVRSSLTKFDRNASYDVAEVGFSYTHKVERLLPHLPLSAATAYAGYRYQRIETDTPSGNNRTDLTQGFVIGLNLSF